MFFIMSNLPVVYWLSPEYSLVEGRRRSKKRLVTSAVRLVSSEFYEDKNLDQ